MIDRGMPAAMPRSKTLSSVLCAALLLAACSVPAKAGAWKFERDARTHPILSFSDYGKLQFQLACGRALGLHVRYPGTAANSGKTFITISSGRARMKLQGEFQEPEADDATTFVQWDLGFSRQDPALFEKRWKRIYLRLLDLIGSGHPVAISSSNGSYRLPPPDVSGWKTALAECGG
jgi:hypothetical protein